MDEPVSGPEFWSRRDSAVLRIPVSAGELLDKITILTIKSRRVRDAGKRSAASCELALLKQAAASLPLANRSEGLAALVERLEDVNAALWDVEDTLRAMERDEDFGKAFIEAARSVYRLNDERARLKNELNQAVGCPLVEVKEYAEYPSGADANPPPLRSASGARRP